MGKNKGYSGCELPSRHHLRPAQFPLIDLPDVLRFLSQGEDARYVVLTDGDGVSVKTEVGGWVTDQDIRWLLENGEIV